MLEVCIGSFYLSFLIVLAMMSILLFYSIRLSQNNYEHIIILTIIFDVIILMTLPLLMLMTYGIC